MKISLGYISKIVLEKISQIVVQFVRTEFFKSIDALNSLFSESISNFARPSYFEATARIEESLMPCSLDFLVDINDIK